MTAAATERVGRYQLLEPLGVGPSGAVSRAKVFGVAGFERQFAIKRFHPELTSTAVLAQALSAAARAYGSLEHPRIARMSEFGVAQGTTFTAVEYVAGLDALRLIAEAKMAGATLAPGGALALVSQAARAVGYAHGRGLTHLGLAPTNVLITAEGDIKITDFGILSATLPPRPIEVPRLANRIPYLAPEQLAGEATSAATDVFALGVLAYELVTGHRTFRGETAQQIAQSVMAGPPIEPPLPRPIVRVLQRCLARSPFERFPDARALADALDAALRVAPVPGTRKDIGTQVKQTMERLAALHEGEMSGVVALNLGTGPVVRVEPPSPPAERPPRPPSAADSSDDLVTSELERTQAEPGLAPRPLQTPPMSPSATVPDLRPGGLSTVPGLPPMPVPVPQGVAPPQIPPPPPPINTNTLVGLASKPPQIPSAKPPGVSIPPVSPRAGTVPGAGPTERPSVPPVRPTPRPIPAVPARPATADPTRPPAVEPTRPATADPTRPAAVVPPRPTTADPTQPAADVPAQPAATAAPSPGPSQAGAPSERVTTARPTPPEPPASGREQSAMIVLGYDDVEDDDGELDLETGTHDRARLPGIRIDPDTPRPIPPPAPPPRPPLPGTPAAPATAVADRAGPETGAPGSAAPGHGAEAPEASTSAAESAGDKSQRTRLGLLPEEPSAFASGTNVELQPIDDEPPRVDGPAAAGGPAPLAPAPDAAHADHAATPATAPGDAPSPQAAYPGVSLGDGREAALPDGAPYGGGPLQLDPQSGAAQPAKPPAHPYPPGPQDPAGYPPGAQDQGSYPPAAELGMPGREAEISRPPAPGRAGSGKRLLLVAGAIAAAGALGVGGWFAYGELVAGDGSGSPAGGGPVAVGSGSGAVGSGSGTVALGSGSGSGAVGSGSDSGAIGCGAVGSGSDSGAAGCGAVGSGSGAATIAPTDAAITVAAADASPPLPPVDAPKPSSELSIVSTPPGARVFLDGADVGATPLKLPGTPDRHTVALLLPRHELYVAQVDGHGQFAIPLKEVTPGPDLAGIKVLRCKDKDRHYVFVDGKPTGQTCPTERINTTLGKHTVEVYDVVTETRRKWEIDIKDGRLSYRIRIDP